MRRLTAIRTSLAAIAALTLLSSSAERTANSFFTIEGEGVGIADDGNVRVKAGSSGPVTVTAREGWLVNGRESIVYSNADVISNGVVMTSKLHEDHACFPPPASVEERHEATFVIGAAADPANPIKMYALPATSIVVSVSAESSLIRSGLHLVTTTRPAWTCPVCGKNFPALSDVVGRTIVPDEWEWTAEALGERQESSTWTGTMTKGLDQEVEFTVTGRNGGCSQCAYTTNAVAYVDVHELSIARPDYLGLDRTDAGRSGMVLTNATAKIDPEPARAAYEWTNCGKCQFVGATDEQNVAYGITNSATASAKYLAEELKVSATAWNEEGNSASANCTSNFTVVAVDVSVGGAGEDGEEENAKEVYYCKDNDDGSLKDFAKENLVPVKITCQPEDLPGSVELTLDSKYAQLFERGKGGSVTLAQTSYPCSEIGKEDFALHGHSLPDGWIDKVISFFTTDSLTVTHSDSGAIDKGAFKVVPPPPLEVTDVQFLSPSKKKNGDWPYDPVWDDDDWKLTVDGSLAKECAEDVDEATVKYTLSRDAKKVDIEFLMNDTYKDKCVGSIKDAACAGGVQSGIWAMPKDLKTGEYYAKIVAIETETDEERTAKSNEAELKRDCYYFAPNIKEPIRYKQIGTVSALEQLKAEAQLFLCVDICGSAAGKVAEGIAKFLKAAKWVEKFASTVSSESVSFQLTVNSDFDEIPAWLHAGVKIYECNWTVERYTWDDKEYCVKDDYSTLSTITPQGQVITVSTTIQHGRFEMGYTCYAQRATTNLGPNREQDESMSQDFSIKKGFYNSEYETISVLQFLETSLNGYRLQDWGWERKPYGLTEPRVEQDLTVTK